MDQPIITHNRSQYGQWTSTTYNLTQIISKTNVRSVLIEYLLNIMHPSEFIKPVLLNPNRTVDNSNKLNSIMVHIKRTFQAWETDIVKSHVMSSIYSSCITKFKSVIATLQLYALTHLQFNVTKRSAATCLILFLVNLRFYRRLLLLHGIRLRACAKKYFTQGCQQLHSEQTSFRWFIQLMHSSCFILLHELLYCTFVSTRTSDRKNCAQSYFGFLGLRI